MPSIVARLRRGYEGVARRNAWVLAVVPFLAALFRTNEIGRVLSRRGFSVGLAFGLPLPVTTVWKFVSVPSRGLSVVDPGTAVGVGLAAAGFLAQSLLTAGYLGGLRNALAGSELDFVGSARRYAVPFLGFGLLLVGLFVPPLVVGLAGGMGGVFLSIWLVVTFTVGYLVYTAPYLVVLEEEPLVPSLSRSVSLATNETPAFRYAVGYALLVAGVSLPATVLTVNAGPVGVLLGAAVFAPVSLVFDATTLRFVDDLRAGDSALATVDDDGPSNPTGQEEAERSTDERVD